MTFSYCGGCKNLNVHFIESHMEKGRYCPKWKETCEDIIMNHDVSFESPMIKKMEETKDCKYRIPLEVIANDSRC